MLFQNPCLMVVVHTSEIRNFLFLLFHQNPSGRIRMLKIVNMVHKLALVQHRIVHFFDGSSLNKILAKI